VVRHASPQIDPDVPARDWPLSAAGIDEARVLASVSASWGLRALYSSTEDEARATAQAIGDVAGLPCQQLDGLDELRIDGWIGEPDAFAALVRSIFHMRRGSIQGAEPGRDAAARFAKAIGTVRAGPLPAAAVSHGRVIAAWLAQLLEGIDAFEVWRSIPMPGYAVIELDDHPPRLVRPFQGVARR